MSGDFVDKLKKHEEDAEGGETDNINIIKAGFSDAFEGYEDFIEVSGAKKNNLKNISVKLPKNKMVVVTGPSGAGKSSLAFSTIYAEGQRRYVESLSPYSRHFFNLQDKPEVDYINGLSPSIAIEQKSVSKNPRSIVATATEIYDYLRLLYARAGVPYSPVTNEPIKGYSASKIIEIISSLPKGTKFHIEAYFVRGRKGLHDEALRSLIKRGFVRFRIDGEVYESDNLPELDKNKKHDMAVIIDRMCIDDDLDKVRLESSVSSAIQIGDGTVIVEIIEAGKKEDDEGEDEGPYSSIKGGQKISLSTKIACPVSGFTIDEIEPRIFSFNSPYGACTACNGMGKESKIDINLIVPDINLSIMEGAIDPVKFSADSGISEQVKYFYQVFACLAKHYKFDLNTPWKELSERVRNIIMFGSGDEQIELEYEINSVRYRKNHSFQGIIRWIEESRNGGKSRPVSVVSTEIQVDRYSGYLTSDSKYYSVQECSVCNGYRLKRDSLCVKINNLHIGNILEMTVEDSLAYMQDLPNKLFGNQKAISANPVQEITKRLKFLKDVGLGYLSLSRETSTLSGGESQRIRIASQIGSGLSGILYVLDEPSIGLHQRDNDKLLDTLKVLRDIGNTVILVEHDEDTIAASDYIIDIGPEAGNNGGYIMAYGTPDEVKENANSITGMYMSGKKYIPIPKIRNKIGKNTRFLEIIGASANNLKNIDVKFPLQKFIAVTGVSGSGKSTLILQTLCGGLNQCFNKSKVFVGEHKEIRGLENLDKVIEITQAPIGRTPLSNPVTYVGAFTPIRELFTKLPESKARGYKPCRFSFNTKGGRCEACTGNGVIKIEMHFLPDVYVQCEACNGRRYNKETLEIKYKGKDISDILEMTVSDAAEFFKNVPIIYEKMHAMEEVGLGYLQIGLSSTLLSGGEAQRVKLSKELSKKSTGKTIYILDEPTTGLHTHDVRNLLNVLKKLVRSGNTVIVIEHNLEVIKTVDYVIDIGPEGGNKGGEVVCCGSPEDIADNENSVTGHYIKKILEEQKDFYE